MSPRAAGVSAVALLASVAMLGAAVGFTPLRSYDYWWHLKTGAWIAENGAVPSADPYTYTLSNAPWTDLHWSFQLALYGVYTLWGHEGVRAAKGAAVLALLAVVGAIGWRTRRAAVTALALSGLVLGAEDRLFERPELASFLLFAAVLALLDRHRRRSDAAVFWIVPIQWLWANLHGLFAVGLAAVGMALAAELLRPLVRRGEPRSQDAIRRLAAVLALSIAASFITPHGAAGVAMPLEQLGMIGPGESRSDLGTTINELQPILGVAGGPATLAAATAFALLGLVLNWRRVDPFDGLLFAALVWLTLTAQRNVALLAIAGAPIAVRNWNAWLDRHPPPEWVQWVFVSGALAVVGTALAARTAGSSPLWSAEALWPSRFPVAAVDWIERERPPGPIFHAMGDGGYLIWRLHPDYRVMVDGRLEVFGAEQFARLRTRAAGQPDAFRRLDEQYRFGVALIHYRFYPTLRLLTLLHRDPDWRLVAMDDVAAVLVRTTAASRAWPAFDAERLAPLPPPSANTGAARDADLRARFGRFGLLAALDRRDLADALVLDTCARYPDATAPFRCARGGAARSAP